MFTQNKNSIQSIKNERGFVLVVALVLLLVLSIIGVMGITSSTVENIMAGNTRLRSTHFFEADSGVQIAMPMVNQVMGDKNNDGFAGLIPNFKINAFVQELTLQPFAPDCRDDFKFEGNDGLVSVDIDRMYRRRAAGCSIEFASEADIAGRCTNVFYRINSTSASAETGAKATVGTVYRYVPTR